MSKPPIYPRGCDPNYPIHVEGLIWAHSPKRAWPVMLGLLTLIGDAVRGAPWGKPMASPVLPEVGSVWITPDRLGTFVVSKVDGKYVFPDGYGWTVRDFHDGTLTPATVIPTPTADGWINPADELPASGQDIWRWTADAGTYLEVMWSADIEHWRQVLAAGGTLTWRWQPVPPGIIPPPPADRDRGR